MARIVDNDGAMRPLPIRLIAVLGALGLVVLGLTPDPAGAQANVVGQWRLLSHTSPINPIHVTVLRSGRILIASGSENDPTHTAFRAAVYDWRTGAFALQNVPWDLFCNAMSQLPDGRVLITGGNGQYNPFRGLRTTTVFDPATQRFIQVQDMARGRWYPSNASLADGRTMVFSGWLETGGTNNAVEIYDIPTGWSPESPAPFTPPLYPWLHLLPNGRVFFSGSSPTTRFFNPATRTWTTGPTTVYGGNRRYGSSVLLPLRPQDGYRPRVMIMGGNNPATASAELIDLGAASPAWRRLPDMSAPRIEMNAVILPTGQVLALGGSRVDNDATTASLGADLFDPDTETWSPAGRGAVPRLYHSVALLLPDATVWVAGSNPFQGSWDNRMEIYSPAYLFTPAGSPAPRPTITAAPSRIDYNAPFSVSTPNAADIASAVLVRPGSNTHAFDFEQRLVGLHFTAASGTLTLTSPLDSNVAPPGYYMLFLVNRAGTPSVARFIQLAADAGNQPPRGSITAPSADVTIRAGETVTFAGDATDPDGSVARFSWIFPGGSPGTSTARVPGAVTFATPGAYIVSLTAVDDRGENDPSPPTRTITVQPPGFTASFTSPPSGATVDGNQTVGMAVSGGGTAPFTFTLKIDGVQTFTQTTSATSASYVWNTLEAANGSHTLALTVSDSASRVSTVTRTVNVDNGGQMRVALTTPSPGQTVSGVFWVNVWVDNAAGPYSYTLSAGGQTVWTQSSSNAHVALPWETTKTPNGPQTLTATVQTALKTASTSVNVTVQNGEAPLAAAFTSPPAGATVSGNVAVGMSASGGQPNYTFTLRIDGRIVLNQSGPATTASYPWDTAVDGNGSHTLDLTITDGGGASATGRRTVTVSNGGGSTGDLRVALTSPKAGATVSGTVWANIWVDSPGTAPYQYTMAAAGTTVWTQSSSSTHVTLPWETPKTPNGSQTLTVTVRDAAGKTGTATVGVTVQNGAASLAAAFTSPTAGATVSGVVTIGMAASNGTGPYTYMLRIDGTQAFTTTTATTTASHGWNTATATNASHTLDLAVNDSAGATATARRTVTVNNAGATGDLRIALTSPKAGATVNGTVWANIWVDSPGTAPYQYTMSAAGATVWSEPSSSTHVTLPWETPKTPNGPQTLNVTVRDAAGKTGTATIGVTVQNP